MSKLDRRAMEIYMSSEMTFEEAYERAKYEHIENHAPELLKMIFEGAK